MFEKIKITFTGGGNLGDELELPLDRPVLVGRSHSAAIRFRESDVSGKHLEISASPSGVSALNLSRYKASVNGLPIQPGESCPVNVGDVFALGTKARFRIDSLGAAKEPAGDGATDTGLTRMPPADDRETKAMTQAGTFATRPFPATASETFATRASSSSDVLVAVAAPPFADSDATGLVSTGDAAGIEPDPFAESATGLLDPSTQTGASAADGATQVMQTRAGSMDEIERFKRLMEQKRRVRRSLLAVAAVFFLAVLGAVVWIRWPKAEVWLTVPRAGGKADLGIFTVKSPKGDAFVVDFPNAEGGRIRRAAAADGAGFFVSTFTGRDRDVPFRLEVVRQSQADELKLSLEESAACAKARLEETCGFVFLSPAEWQDGCFFFESEYPGSCPSPRLMRGTRFYRSEYQVTRENLVWHGILFLFRDGTDVWMVQREIPASQWPRGKWLLREDPNLQLYPAFTARRWESPGKSGLLAGRDLQRLIDSVKRELDFSLPRVAEWPRVKKEIDTLIAETWTGDEKTKARCRLLLEKFRRMQDAKYVEFRNEFELAKRLDSRDRRSMASIRADCQSVFGKDPTDRRFLLIGNPETWSCREEK